MTNISKKKYYFQIEIPLLTLFRMILSEDDIITLVESYKNSHDYNQGKMAELCGMANASVYNKWVKKKTDGGKLRYLLDFLKNTDQNINILFPNRNANNNNSEKSVNDPAITTYSCPDCITKEKTIQDLRETIELQNELLDHYRPKKEKGCG